MTSRVPPSDLSASGRVRGSSVGTKLGLAVAAVVILIGVFAAQSLAQRERANLIHAKQLGAERVVRLFTLSIYPALDFDDEVGLAESLDRLTRDREIVAAYVWGLEGSEPRVEFERNADALPEPRRSEPAGVEFEVVGEQLIAHAPILDDAGTKLGVTTIHWSLAREQTAFTDELELIVLGTSIAGFVVIALIFTATRLIVVRPLARLEHAAIALGRGEAVGHDVAKVRASRDEVGRLARVFAQMAAEIGDREQRLRAAHNEIAALFDNMRQAIISVGPDCKIVGRSSLAARELLGSTNLAGQDLCEVLLAELDEGDPERIGFELWLETALAGTEAQWSELEALAPEELTLPRTEGGDVELRLEFRPFFDDGKVARIMLLATDESEKRRLEREAKARESAHEVEMKVMRRIAASGTIPFAGFLRSSAVRLERVIQLFGPGPIPIPVHQEMYRHIHTIKGEARTFGLIELEGAAAIVEDTLERVRPPRPLTPELGVSLREQLDTIGHALEAARARLVEASPIGAEVLDQITVSSLDLDRVRALVRAGDSTVRAAVDQLAARPLGECVAGLADAAPTWAAAHGKRVRLEVLGGAIRLPASLAEVLRGSVTHLVRNAIAHGIEAGPVREARGKHTTGRVTIEARRRGSSVEILVADDGGGLDLDALAEHRGVAREHASEGADEWVFEDGTSTHGSVDDLAGRGVGLAAVRRELADVGFAITITKSDAHGTLLTITAA